MLIVYLLNCLIVDYEILFNYGFHGFYRSLLTIFGCKHPIFTDRPSLMGICNNWALAPFKFPVGHPFNLYNP